MTAILKNPLLVGILQVAGPIFFLTFQGSSLRTALEIWNNRSVGGYAFLPFASLLTNCVIWSFYGLLKEDYTVLLPNLLGVVTGFICVGSYKRYAESSDLPVTLGSLIVLIVALSMYMSSSADSLGTLGCALAMLVMGSPLATLGTVIREKSTASMPFLTSFATWCNALSWSLYGLLVADDVMVRCCLSLALRSYRPSLIYFPPKYADLWPKPCGSISGQRADGVVWSVRSPEGRHRRGEEGPTADESKVFHLAATGPLISVSRWSCLGHRFAVLASLLVAGTVPQQTHTHNHTHRQTDCRIETNQ